VVAVGDFVAVRRAPGGGVIEALLPRRTAFSRPDGFSAQGVQVMCANIDVLFIVQALGHDYNPRRMERYLTAAWDSGAVPVLVLNKADTVTDAAAFIEEMGYLAPGVEVLAVSAMTGEGLEALRARCPAGQTCCLMGSSGVGKSTLINALAGFELAETGAVREDDQRGRHTTTYRELHRMAWGALLIDTPGMREFGVRMGDADAVFAEITALAANCRFADCRHEREPGCAVKAAVASGALDAKRLESYRTLSREVSRSQRHAQYLQRIADKATLSLTDKKHLRKQPAPDWKN